MPPIDGLGRIVQILQTKVSERDKNIVSQKTSLASQNNPNVSPSNKKLSVTQLEKKITEKLKAISEENANTPYLARHFVESILTWEFGDDILQDPKFSDLSREVVESFKTNPQTWQKMEAMLKQLRTK